MQLEPNADIACREQERNVALTAGPGAGKTELLAQRADFLLRSNTCPYPKRILAISFKVDAAANLAARVRERVPYELANRLDSYTFHAFSIRLIRRFRALLTGTDRLEADFTVGKDRIEGQQITFKDFIPLATDVLHNPHVLAALRATYSHVFLDEFQDCTNEQYKLVTTAFKGTDIRVTAVGDTKQRIMAWAGALEGIFETYREDFAARPLNLYQNFRSEPKLRRMQNRMVLVMDPSAAVVPESLPGDEGEIEIIEASDADDEADTIAAAVSDLIDDGVAEQEIAVLYDKQPELYSVRLQTALDARGIPHRDEQSLQDLAKEPLTRLLLDYLRLIVGPAAPSAYARLSRSRLFDYDDDTSLFRLRSRWQEHVAASRSLMGLDPDLCRDRTALESLTDGVLELFGSDAIAALHPDYQSKDRLNEIRSSTLDRIEELLRDGAPADEALARFADEQAVKIMSIHKSKGLEFEAVFVAAVEEEMYWGERESERAAFFVAISRAKRRLFLTTAAERTNPAHVWRWSVSRTQLREFLDYVDE